MGVHTEYNKLITTTKPKTFCFDLSKDDERNLTNETNSIIKHNF